MQSNYRGLLKHETLPGRSPVFSRDSLLVTRLNLVNELMPTCLQKDATMSRSASSNGHLVGRWFAQHKPAMHSVQIFCRGFYGASAAYFIGTPGMATWACRTPVVCPFTQAPEVSPTLKIAREEDLGFLWFPFSRFFYPSREP